MSKSVNQEANKNSKQAYKNLYVKEKNNALIEMKNNETVTQTFCLPVKDRKNRGQLENKQRPISRSICSSSLSGSTNSRLSSASSYCSSLNSDLKLNKNRNLIYSIKNESNSVESDDNYDELRYEEDINDADYVSKNQEQNEIENKKLSNDSSNSKNETEMSINRHSLDLDELSYDKIKQQFLELSFINQFQAIQLLKADTTSAQFELSSWEEKRMEKKNSNSSTNSSTKQFQFNKSIPLKTYNKFSAYKNFNDWRSHLLYYKQIKGYDKNLPELMSRTSEKMFKLDKFLIPDDEKNKSQPELNKNNSSFQMSQLIPPSPQQLPLQPPPPPPPQPQQQQNQVEQQHIEVIQLLPSKSFSTTNLKNLLDSVPIFNNIALSTTSTSTTNSNTNNNNNNNNNSNAATSTNTNLNSKTISTTNNKILNNTSTSNHALGSTESIVNSNNTILLLFITNTSLIFRY
jgi:hypothetical protein